MSRKCIATFVGTKETVKVYRDSEWNEYRISTIYNNMPSVTCFDDDKQSALDTARMIAGPEVKE